MVMVVPSPSCALQVDGALQQLNIPFYNMQSQSCTLYINGIFTSEETAEQVLLIFF